MERYNEPNTQDLERQRSTINIPAQNNYNANAIEVTKSTKEGKIIGSPDYISYNSTRTIISQMEKCIAKIKVEGVQGTTEQGTAFFCKIPFPDENGGYTGLTKDVLITNNHIINSMNSFYQKTLHQDLKLKLYRPHLKISLRD